MPTNYNNGKIYKIWSTQTDDIYIGSTTQPLSKRIGEHRRKYKMYQNGKYGYTSSYKILEYGDARIELIEDCKCERREELTAREGHFIRTLDCVNKCIPGRAWKEYFEDNREKIRQKDRQYREDNREKIRQKDRQYHHANREKMSQKNKQYREANKEKIRQKDKQKYQKNKDKILQQKKQYYQDKCKEKVTCECGAIIAKGGLSRHRKTQVHIKAMTK